MFVKAAKVRAQTERAMILMLREKGAPTVEKCIINIADDDLGILVCDARFQSFGLYSSFSTSQTIVQINEVTIK